MQVGGAWVSATPYRLHTVPPRVADFFTRYLFCYVVRPLFRALFVNKLVCRVPQFVSDDTRDNVSSELSKAFDDKNFFQNGVTIRHVPNRLRRTWRGVIVANNKRIT